MNMLKHKISKEEAINAAIEHVKKRKKGAPTAITDVEEHDGEWIVKGTCPSDEEGSTWAEKFEIIVDNKSRVKSADYALRWQKNEADESWTIFTEPPSSEAKAEKEVLKQDIPEESDAEVLRPIEPPVIESSKSEYLRNVVNQKQNQENVISMESSLEQADRKMQLLKAKKKQYELEREKLKKRIDEKVSSLETEVKGMETEVRKMKLMLSDETEMSAENQTVEMQMTR